MKIKDYFLVSWSNLWRRRGRTFLTMAGVVIGTAAIVVMIDLGLGMQRSMLGQFESFGGAKEITVMPKMEVTGGAVSISRVKDESKITDDTIKKILKLDNVAGVMPDLGVLLSSEISIGRNASEMTVSGYDPSHRPEDPEMFEGKSIEKTSGNVMVMGYKVPELFGGNTPSENLSLVEQQMSADNSSAGSNVRIDVLNKTAKLTVKFTDENGKDTVKTFRYKIIGVLKETGGNSDYSIYIPMDEAASINALSGNAPRTLEYDYLTVTATSNDAVDALVHDIADMDYTVFSVKEILAVLDSMIAIIQAVLAGIGSISLLVASIGIINTMIMAIYERTKEIGIMKVAGATLKNIRNIFLCEATIIGFLGGIMGVLLSYIIVMILDLFMSSYLQQQGQAVQSMLSIPVYLAVGAALFSAFIGLVAGYYPAVKASKLSTLDAIRSE